MAELAQGSSQLSLHKPAEVGLARARLIWVMRPLGFLGLLLWVLHPNTSDRFDHAHMALIGFLLGAVYGLIVYGPQLKRYVSFRQPSGRHQANRVPEEYYWGQIDSIMFDNR